MNHTLNDLLVYDIIIHITEFLPWIDKRAFKCTGSVMNNIIPSLNDCIRRDATKHLMKKLDEPSEVIDRLFKCISDCKCVISGSSVLQWIYGVNWEESDIDIYGTSYEAMAMEYALEEDFGCTRSDQLVHEPPDHYPAVFHVYAYKTRNNTKIQVITIQNGMATKKYIEEKFDLDFNKVLFDGQRLLIYKWESLINKQSLYGSTTTATFARSEYYDNRRLNNYGKSMVLLARKRKEKYEERGFKIEFSPVWESMDASYQSLVGSEINQL